MTKAVTPPAIIYLLDYGSDECTWCEDPDPSGEDHKPIAYVLREQAEALAKALMAIVNSGHAISQPLRWEAEAAIAAYRSAKP